MSRLWKLILAPAMGLALAFGSMAGLAGVAAAQSEPLRIEITDNVVEPIRIAIPAFQGGAAAAAQIRDVIVRDLTGTGLFIEADPIDTAAQGFADAVDYGAWKAGNVRALVKAEVTGDGDTISVRFRLFDIFAGQPLGDGIQFDARSTDWRRAAHKVADQIYTRLTGETGYFDSRIAFVQETGPKNARIKRIGIMDYDGANILWMTDSSSLVLSPNFSGDGTKLAFTSFDSGFPQIRILDVATVSSYALTESSDTMAFSPRFSTDGRRIVYSREVGGNTDIWLLDVATGAQRALTDAPSIETSASLNPNGTQVVFESDRSGTPQLYVSGLNGGEPERISFGEGRYGDPAWSPKGDLIAFTKQVGDRFHIGIMRTDGSGEKILTDSFLDESPTWAPNGRVLMFSRVSPGGNGEPRLHSVDITGRIMRPVDLEFAASDPSWGPLLP